MSDNANLLDMKSPYTLRRLKSFFRGETAVALRLLAGASRCISLSAD